MGSDYLTREDWGARPPARPYVTFPDSKYVGMEAHHTVGQGGVPAAQGAREVQNFHLDVKGWTDIFYAFLIHQDGTLVEGRGWNKAQGTENTWDPDGSGPIPKGYLMPVVFLGNYESGQSGLPPALQLTDAQVETWHALRAFLLAKNPQATGVRYHKMRSGTACPGNNVIDNFYKLEQAPVKPGPDPTPPPSNSLPIPGEDFNVDSKWDHPYVYCIRAATGEPSAQFWTDGAVKVQVTSKEYKRKMAYWHGVPNVAPREIPEVDFDRIKTVK